MRVLHATRGTVDAVLAGCPILPVEGRECEWCRGERVRPTIDAATGRRSIDPCPVCWNLLPPVLSGRIAVAVDGAIIGTATAREVLPVVDGWDAAPGFPRRAVVAGTGAPVVLVAADSDDPMTPTVLAADPTELDLSSGWVVLVEDVTLTHPPVPVLQAPPGTLSDWEGT